MSSGGGGETLAKETKVWIDYEMKYQVKESYGSNKIPSMNKLLVKRFP